MGWLALGGRDQFECGGTIRAQSSRPWAASRVWLFDSIDPQRRRGLAHLDVVSVEIEMCDRPRWTDRCGMGGSGSEGHTKEALMWHYSRKSERACCAVESRLARFGDDDAYARSVRMSGCAGWWVGGSREKKTGGSCGVLCVHHRLLP